MKKHQFRIITFCLAYGLIVSCEQPIGSFDRINENDPVNEEYDPGAASNLNISFNNQGIIKISWKDSAEFEDGYIIEKSLGNALRFEEIGRVGENITAFRDSSKEVRPQTFYRVSAYLMRNDSLKRFEAVEAQMTDFGSITHFEGQFDEASQTYELNWTDDSPFNSKLILQYRPAGGTYTNIGELGPEVTSYTDELFDISFKDREYRLQLVGESRSDNPGPTIVEIMDQDTTEFAMDIFYPSELDVQVQDEQNIMLSWNDNSYFEEGYELYRAISSQGGQFELVKTFDSNTTSYQDQLDLKDNSVYNYKVLGFKSETTSDTLSFEVDYQIPRPNLINDRYNNTDETAIQLSWTIADDSYVNEYIIERKISAGDPWVEIARFAKTASSFTDTGTDPTQPYFYRIRTISSAYSEHVELYYRRLYNKIATLDSHSRGISDLDFSPDGMYLASSSNIALGYGDTYVNIWNLTTFNLSRTLDYHQEPVTAVHFSNDGSMLASSSWFDHTINVYDFATGSLIRSFNGDAHDVKFSPDNIFVAATGGFGDIRKWEISSGDLIFHYPGNDSPNSAPHYIAFHPFDDYITTTDRRPIVINSIDGSLITQLTTSDDYNTRYENDPSFSADGSKIAFIYSNGLHVRSSGSWDPIYYSNNYGRFAPKFKPDNSNIILGIEGWGVHVRDINAGSIINRINADGNVLSFDISPDGTVIAFGLENSLIELWKESTFKGWKEIY